MNSARFGGAWPGMAGFGPAWLGALRVTGRPRGSSPRHPRRARRCVAGMGTAWPGQAWPGSARHGASGARVAHIQVRVLDAHATRHGMAGSGSARHGEAWQGKYGARLADTGVQVPGAHASGLGRAWRGGAGQGKEYEAGDWQPSGFKALTPTKRIDTTSTGRAGRDTGSRTLGRKASTMQIELVGTQPLLMHNIRLADDQEPYVKAIKELTAKKTRKTEDDKLEIDRLSFAGGLYWDEELGPYLPAENIFRCLMEAGSLTRDGKKIERGVVFHQTRAQLEYVGPRDIESLWGENGKSRYVDRRMVAVQRQRIPRVRPIFPDWAASISVEIDTEVIDLPSFESIVSKAGRMIGLGDYRRFYGKFDGKVIA